MEPQGDSIVVDSFGAGGSESRSDPKLDMLDSESIEVEEYIKKLQAQMANSARMMDPQASSISTYVFIFAFLAFFSALGFFSYKLIKSLSEKERKREEKRKLKELKKKK